MTLCSKTAVSLPGICSRRTSHLCLASFSLSHSSPNLAADTSFSARCTSCTLEQIFLPGTLPPDRLHFVLQPQSSTEWEWKRSSGSVAHSSYLAYVLLSVWVADCQAPGGFAAFFSLCHKFSKQQRGGQEPVQFEAVELYMSFFSKKSSSYSQGGTVTILQAQVPLEWNTMVSTSQLLGSIMQSLLHQTGSS